MTVLTILIRNNIILYYVVYDNANHYNVVVNHTIWCMIMLTTILYVLYGIL